MIDSLRAEFPSLDRVASGLRRPSVASEPVGWGFLAGLGAGVVVGGVVRVALLWLYPLLLPATEPHPYWLTPYTLATGASAIATGAVLLRASGAAAVAAYVAYELLLRVAAVPGRAAYCADAGLVPDLGSGPGIRGCDYWALVAELWPVWLGLALGLLASRLLVARPGGANRLLRAAGAYGIVPGTTGAFVGVVYLSGTAGDYDAPLAFTALLALATIVAGALAGAVLVRARAAAAVLLALLVAAPAVALSLPLVLTNAPYAEPPDATILRWSGVALPVAGGLAILAAWSYLRRHVEGNRLLARL